MSRLEDILKLEIGSEISAQAAEAEAKAISILETAKAKAESLLASRQKALEAELAAATRRAESAAELVVNQARIRARGQVMDQVKAGVLSSLDSLAAKPGYAQVLVKLADEALESLGQAEAIVVNPSDRGHLEGWAGAKGLEVRTDANIKLGVRLIAKGGKANVLNTLTERLERAWDELSVKASKALWG